jgi:hypothetical protein
MNTSPQQLSTSTRARTPFFLGLAVAAALALGACGGAVIATVPPSLPIPTLPADVASGAPDCVDAPTMAIIDQVGAAGADVPALLSANKDALITGLENLDSTDPAVATWRDEFVGALESGNMDLAALQVAKLTNGEVTLPPC